MRTFRLPSIFIFTLDITLKYISVLGEICAAILTSVRLRSVGKNPQKAKALSGVLGISFLKSGEMAEEMHAAMCCRGFTGEYKKKQKYIPTHNVSNYTLLVTVYFHTIRTTNRKIRKFCHKHSMCICLSIKLLAVEYSRYYNFRVCLSPNIILFSPLQYHSITEQI